MSAAAIPPSKGPSQTVSISFFWEDSMSKMDVTDKTVDAEIHLDIQNVTNEIWVDMPRILSGDETRCDFLVKKEGMFESEKPVGRLQLTIQQVKSLKLVGILTGREGLISLWGCVRRQVKENTIFGKIIEHAKGISLTLPQNLEADQKYRLLFRADSLGGGSGAKIHFFAKLVKEEPTTATCVDESATKKQAETATAAASDQKETAASGTSTGATAAALTMTATGSGGQAAIAASGTSAGAAAVASLFTGDIHAPTALGVSLSELVAFFRKKGITEEEIQKVAPRLIAALSLVQLKHLQQLIEEAHQRAKSHPGKEKDFESFVFRLASAMVREKELEPDFQEFERMLNADRLLLALQKAFEVDWGYSREYADKVKTKLAHRKQHVETGITLKEFANLVQRHQEAGITNSAMNEIEEFLAENLSTAQLEQLLKEARADAATSASKEVALAAIDKLELLAYRPVIAAIGPLFETDLPRALQKMNAIPAGARNKMLTRVASQFAEESSQEGVQKAEMVLKEMAEGADKVLVSEQIAKARNALKVAVQANAKK